MDDKKVVPWPKILPTLHMKLPGYRIISGVGKILGSTIFLPGLSVKVAKVSCREISTLYDTL